MQDSKSIPKKYKGKTVIGKGTLNMIRTTYRNNIDLTNIADNKANILLSLNSLMITFLIPIVLTNLDIIQSQALYLPIITLSLTCITTIIIAAMATRPIKMGQQDVKRGDMSQKSPFFFGNYYKMQVEDYLDLVENAINDPKLVKDYVKLDLYFMGKGLGEKYRKIRTCYNVFIGGIVITVMATIIAILS
ncbi:MAG: hypothetical protein HKN76_03145 [Saprospiraceae bacterium]|nr:hypothetical protein [Saprospiraceae bacterium]